MAVSLQPPPASTAPALRREVPREAANDVVGQAGPAGAASVRRELRSLSCVLPCRDEADNLRVLLPRLVDMLADLVPRWEIVLVDDGSRDDIREVAAEWMAFGPVRLLELSRNFGKEAALSAGLDTARGDAVLLMDADLQHPPELLPAMVERWRDGADMVCMVRDDRADESLFKRVGSRAFYRLVNPGRRYALPPDAGDFRLLDRSVVEALRALPERTRFMKGLYAWVGFRSVAIPYRPPPRATGRSHFGLRSLLRLSITGLTAFTTWPLRAASYAGFALALASFVYALYLVASYALGGHPVSGWTTIVVGMLFLSGVQLVSLGILGEYVGRIFDEVKHRPLYVVRRESGQGLCVKSP